MISFYLPHRLYSLCFSCQNYLSDTFQDSEGTFILPEAVEFDTMQHMVVYDGNTSCLENRGNLAEVLHFQTDLVKIEAK